MFLAIAAGMSAPYLLAFRATGLAAISAEARPMDGARETIDGFSAARDVALSSLRARRATRRRRRHLDFSFLLVVSLVCWMKGAFLTPTHRRALARVVLVLMLVLVIGSGYYFIGEKFRAGQTSRRRNSAGGDWQTFTPERCSQNWRRGTPFLSISPRRGASPASSTKRPCSKAPRCVTHFKRHGVVKLKADWTNADPAITKLLKQFGRPGVPLYVLYPAGKITDCLSGIADEKHRPGKTRNHRAASRVAINL